MFGRVKAPAADAPPAALTGLGVLEDPIVYNWACGLLALHYVVRQLLSASKSGRALAKARKVVRHAVRAKLDPNRSVASWCHNLALDAETSSALAQAAGITVSSAAAPGTLSKLATLPGVVAHQFCTFFPFLYAAYTGICCFFFDPALAELSTGSAVDRVYGRSSVGWLLVRFMAGARMRSHSSAMRAFCMHGHSSHPHQRRNCHRHACPPPAVMPRPPPRLG